MLSPIQLLTMKRNLWLLQVSETKTSEIKNNRELLACEVRHKLLMSSPKFWIDIIVSSKSPVLPLSNHVTIHEPGCWHSNESKSDLFCPSRCHLHLVFCKIQRWEGSQNFVFDHSDMPTWLLLDPPYLWYWVEYCTLLEPIGKMRRKIFQLSWFL